MAANKTELIISATDQTAGAFNSVRSGIGGVQSAVAALGVSLSAGAFTAFVKQNLDAADAMSKMAERTGVSVKQLANYKFAAEQSGSSIEAIAKGIKTFSTYATENSDKLKRLGIETKDADKAMRQMADIVASMPDDMRRNAIVTELFGKAGTDLIPMLKLGSEGLAKAAEKSAAYAVEMERLAPLAVQFNDNLAEIKMTAGAAGMSMVNVMAPALAEISRAMAEAAQETGILKALWIGFGGVATAVFTDRLLSDAQKLQKRIREINDTLSSSTPNKDLKFQLQQERAAAEQELDRLKKQADAARADADKAKTPEAEARSRIEQLKKEAEIQRIVNELMPQTATGAKKIADAYKPLAASVAAYQAQLDLQEEKQGKLTKADELSLQAKSKLSVAEQARLKPALDKLAADERELALQEAMNKRRDEAIAAAEKETASIAEQVKAQREHNETIGLTTEQLGDLEVARIDEQIAAKESLVAIFSETPARAAQVEELKNQIAALNELKSARLEGAARQVVADEARKTADEWKRFTDDIERSLTDALMRGFEGGKDGGRNFIDAIQNMLKTAAFKMVIQAIVSPVMGGVQGVLGSGSSGSSGISGGLQSWSGNSVGYGLANAGQFFSSGSAVGPAAPGSVGSLFSGAGQYANWQYGLAGLGGGLLGGAIGGSTGGTLGGIGATVGMAMGGPIGGVIGSVAGGLLGGLFGGGGEDPHNNTDSSSVGFKLSKSGVAGFGTGYYADSTTGFNGQAPFSTIYGQTSGSGRWADSFALPAETIQTINAAVAQLFAGGASLAGGLGLDPNIVNSASVASGTFASVEAALSSLSDEIVKKVIPNIKDFQQANESLGDTASRLVAEFNLTNAIAKMQGQTGEQAFGTGLSGRDQLVQQLGGLTSATATVDSYYQNFFSEAERLESAQKSIAEQLISIGIAQEVTTREQFRAIVETQDLTTEAGRQTYAALLSISGAFASITDAATAAAVASDQAQASAAAALAATNQSWQDQLDILTGVATERSIALRDATDDSTRALMEQVFAQQDLQAAHERAAAAAAQLKSAWTSLANSMIDEVRKIRNEMLTGSESFASLQAMFATSTAQARAGDQAAAGSLAGLASNLLAAGKENSASAIDYARLQGQVSASLVGTIGIVAGQQGIALPNDITASMPQISSTSQTRSGREKRDDEMLKELKALRAEVAALNALTSQTVEHTKTTAKTLDFWNGDGMPATTTA